MRGNHTIEKGIPTSNDEDNSNNSYAVDVTIWLLMM